MNSSTQFRRGLYYIHLFFRIPRKGWDEHPSPIAFGVDRPDARVGSSSSLGNPPFHRSQKKNGVGERSNLQAIWGSEKPPEMIFTFRKNAMKQHTGAETVRRRRRFSRPFGRTGAEIPEDLLKSMTIPKVQTFCDRFFWSQGWWAIQ